MHTPTFRRPSPRRAVTAGLTLGLVLACGAAAAQPGAGGRLAELDTDGDGAISSAEAEAALKTQFEHMDVNHDGQLSQAEFTDARMQMLSALDTDGDGRVTRSELVARRFGQRFGN
jgi:hypothetical protein